MHNYDRGLIAVVFFVFAASMHAEGRNEGIASIGEESTAISGVVSLFEVFDTTQTTIYTAALPLAWNSLESYVGGLVRLSRKLKVHGLLERFEENPIYSGTDDVGAVCGAVADGIIEKIENVSMTVLGTPSNIARNERTPRRQRYGPTVHSRFDHVDPPPYES